MTKYIVRRVLEALPLLVVISALIFFGMNYAMPGGPLSQYTNIPDITPEDLERLRSKLGLDQPVHVRYWNWLINFLQGDWGYSSSKQPVIKMITERLGNTFLLMGISYVLTLLIALPIGVIAAVKQNSVFDHTATTIAFLGFSIPTFWSGLLVLILFGQVLRWLPLGGVSTPGMEFSLLDRIRHLILPVMILSLYGVGHYTRYLRSSMLDVINQDYIRTARSKGLVEERVILGHAFKNAAIPLVTVMALDLPAIFSGAVITETIFSWPGMGRLFLDAANRQDFPVLMGVLMVASTLVVFSNLLADVVYAYLDPRIKYA